MQNQNNELKGKTLKYSTKLSQTITLGLFTTSGPFDVTHLCLFILCIVNIKYKTDICSSSYLRSSYIEKYYFNLEKEDLDPKH